MKMQLPPPPLPPAGVLFDAAQFAPPLALTINLTEPGPRAATRLWTALLESLVFVTAAVSVTTPAACLPQAALPTVCRRCQRMVIALPVQPAVGVSRAQLRCRMPAPLLPAVPCCIAAVET